MHDDASLGTSKSRRGADVRKVRSADSSLVTTGTAPSSNGDDDDDDIYDSQTPTSGKAKRPGPVQYSGPSPRRVPPALPAPAAAALAQRFLRQLGLSSWGGASSLIPVPSTEKLARCLRNLDKNGTSRERHKVGVMYATVDKLDKESVLGAQEGCGTANFETFVGELGWAVDLANHKGYTGLGKFASKFSGNLPYYATPSLEVCFHVISKLNSGYCGTGSANERYRHVGNDPVAIVWCDGGATTTGGSSEVDPVLAMKSWSKVTEAWIVIRPLPSGMYRIQVLWRSDAPPVAPAGAPDSSSSSIICGPLFDGAIIDRQCLAPLVRATAVNCGRALRYATNDSEYETRARYIAQVTAQQEMLGFEQFTSSIIAGGEGNSSAARRRARELRTSGKLKTLRRSVSSECLDSPSPPLSRFAEGARQRSMSQDDLDQVGTVVANDSRLPYKTAL